MVMQNKIAKNFNEKVEELIPDDDVREKLYASMKEYQSSHDLVNLLRSLRSIVNEPDRIEIYDDIRALIPLKHQLLYDDLTPAKPSDKLRVIRLHWRNNEGLGFAIRGGLEHGTGVYVSRVVSDSQAFHQGLRVGDEIVRLNGFTINQAIHTEIINLVLTREELVLKVRHVGMIPVKEHSSEEVSWRYVENINADRSVVLDGNTLVSKNGEHREVKLFLNVGAATGIGCSILSGPPARPGIFIQGIRVGSLAQEVGLEVGDQITEVNATSLEGASHAEAVYLLKESKQLHLTVKRGAGADLFQGRPRCVLPPQEEEEEKAMKLQQLFLVKDQEKIRVHDPEGLIMEKEDTERTEQEKQDIATIQTRLVREASYQHHQPAEEQTKTTSNHQPAEQQNETASNQPETEDDQLQSHSNQNTTESKHTALVQDAATKESMLSKEIRKLNQLSSTKEAPALDKLNDYKQQKEEGEILKQKMLEEKRQEQEKLEINRKQQHEEVRARMLEKEAALFSVLTSQQAAEEQREMQLKKARFIQETAELHRELDLHTPLPIRKEWKPPATHLKGHMPSPLQIPQAIEDLKEPVTYMSGEKKPSFRIQKPVLLSPLPKSPGSESDKTSPFKTAGTSNEGTIIFEEEDDDDEDNVYVDIDEINPNRLFTNEEVAGRQVKVIYLKKDGPLDMSIEKGKSPVQKGIYVSEIFAGGTVHRQGEIACADEILMIEDTRLTKASLSEAHNILKDALQSKKQTLKLIVAKSSAEDYQEQITHL